MARMSQEEKDIYRQLGLFPIPTKPVKISKARLSNALTTLSIWSFNAGKKKGESGGYYTDYTCEWRPSHDQSVNDLAYENEKLRATVYDNDKVIAEYRMRFGDL